MTTATATSPATPWSLHFDRDGTEDVATIRDADGELLVISRPFWLPEADGPTPPTLAALRLMAAAPKLLEALLDALPYVEDVIGNPEQLACFKKGTVQAHARAIRAAIEEATGAVNGGAA